jgi:glycosyltransferase involved in cell wall biosynthesis
MPLVSIIIPTFNRASFLQKTLEAMQAQTHQNWECVIVDDGSTDTTSAVVTAFAKAEPRIRYTKRPSDRVKGANSCRNYGFEIAKGEFINWFDSDDVMLPGFLSKRLEMFQTDTEFVYCSGSYVNSKLEVQRQMQVIDTTDVFKDFIFWNLHIITNSVLFRKRFLDGKKLFDPVIQRGQETDLFSRLFFKVQPHQYEAVHEPLFLYRQHDDSKSAQYEDYNPAIQDSVAYIYAENLKRGLEIKDLEIAQEFYRRSITLWFRAFSFKNIENMDYIEKRMREVLLPSNKTVLKTVQRTFGVCKLIGIPSYKLATYLRNKILKTDT